MAEPRTDTEPLRVDEMGRRRRQGLSEREKRLREQEAILAAEHMPSGEVSRPRRNKMCD